MNAWAVVSKCGQGNRERFEIVALPVGEVNRIAVVTFNEAEALAEAKRLQAAEDWRHMRRHNER